MWSLWWNKGKSTAELIRDAESTYWTKELAKIEMLSLSRRLETLSAIEAYNREQRAERKELMAQSSGLGSTTQTKVWACKSNPTPRLPSS